MRQLAAYFLVPALFVAWPAVLPAAPTALHPQALREIGAVLNEKASWTPAQCKMESQLIHAVRKKRGQAFATGAPNLELDVKSHADGRVLVDIDGTVTPALLAVIAQGGGEVMNSFPQFRTCRALIHLDQLEPLAAAPEVTFIRRAEEGHTNSGSVTSEGDTTHRANSARSTFGVTGAGIKIGVLSDSVDYLTNSQASGDLAAVTVLPGQSGMPAVGEGTAMLEIIHDLAPGAELFFATAKSTRANFAQNILNLRSNGCDIIVDDYGYGSEGAFQDGIVARAVNTVTADGALYFTSAGNEHSFDSGNAGTWEGDFVDGGAAGAPLPESGRLHQFGNLTYNTAVPDGEKAWVLLHWSDPQGGSTNDYDVFVLDSTGTTVLRSSASRQTGTQDPFEFISTLNAGERIVIVKFSGSPRFLHLDTYRGRLAVNTAGATFGHRAATNAISVAEVNIATAYPAAFAGGSANPVEPFSSDGPRHIFFHADGSPITPGNFLATGGAFRQKPDLAAADGVATTVPGFQTFFGTSAAAPHAAAIAALLKSYNPALTPAQIRAVLTSTALDIMTPGPDRLSGAGIVMADAALQAAPPDALFILPGVGFSSRGTAGGPFSVTTQTLTLTNNGTSSFNWGLASTSAWLNVSLKSGTLTPGSSAAAVTVSLNAGASNLVAGADYSAVISFTNRNSGLIQTRRFTLSVTAPPTAPYPNLVMSLNPLAYWQLNETNVPPPSTSLVTNAGTLGPSANGFSFADVGRGQPGRVGNSFRFNNPTASDTYFGSRVDVLYQPALNPNGPFTVEFWVKPTRFSTNLLCPCSSLDNTLNNGASRLGWSFYQENDNTWEFNVGSTNGYVASIRGGAVQTNLWQHVVGVYDGANVSVYVNGQRVAGPTSALGFTANRVAPLRLGTTTLQTATYDGWLDEVALYATNLSANEIAAHFNAASTNNGGYATQILVARPLGYWRLEDPSSNAPARSTLPVAVNIGTVAPAGNGLYQPGSTPGVAGPATGGFGTNNHACEFSNGFGGYVSVAPTYLNILGPLTLLAWTKLNPVSGGTQTILSKGTNSYRLNVDETGRPHFANGMQPGGDLVGTNRLDDRQWHQLAGVYDGIGSEFLYVDGQLVASNTAATTPVLGNANEVWIGADPEISRTFNGVIDEVALFTNRLTSAQIQQLYDVSSNVVSPPILIGTVTLKTNTLSFSWNAIAGQRYQVQYQSILNPTNWNVLSTVTATNSTGRTSDAVNPSSRRFYRLVFLP